VNEADYDKRTALHVAACEGKDNSVRLLLELGADIHALDIQGNTPLDDATREQQNATKRTLQHAACALGLKTPKSRRQGRVTDAGSLLRYFADTIVHDEKNRRVVARNVLIETLGEYGINAEEDPRLEFLEGLPESLHDENLHEIALRLPLLPRALRGELTVPNFSACCDKLEELFHTMCVDSEHVGYGDGDESLDLMTVDGQRLHLGRIKQTVPLDDLGSLIVFAVAVECLEEKDIDAVVGHEPSGENNDSRSVNSDDLPFNPFMWNGMLALLALLQAKIEDVWEVLCLVLTRVTGQTKIENDPSWEEQDKKKRFHLVVALLHSLIARGTLPQTTEHHAIVNLFFRLRSVVASTSELSCMAACFANGGVDIFKNEKVLQATTIKDILTLMFTTGCGAMSGEFCFRIGVPAKSSSVGVLLLVVPNLIGICNFGKAVNEQGVSKAGLKLSFSMGDEFNFHALAGNCTTSAKLDPSLYHLQTDMELCGNLHWAAKKGDISTLVYLRNLGFQLGYTDYDLRSPAHVAAASGRKNCLRYLHKNGVPIDEKDRWGNVPLDDAEKNGHEDIAKLLRKWSANEGSHCGRSTPSDAESMHSHASPMARTLDHAKSDRSSAPVAAKMTNFTSILAAVDENQDIEEDAESDMSDAPKNRNGSRRPSKDSAGGFSADSGSV